MGDIIETQCRTLSIIKSIFNSHREGHAVLRSVDDLMGVADQAHMFVQSYFLQNQEVHQMQNII